jgi:hypothetical protein
VSAMETASMKPSAMETAPVKSVEPTVIEKRVCSGVRLTKSAEVPRRCCVEVVSHMGRRMSGEPIRMKIMAH